MNPTPDSHAPDPPPAREPDEVPADDRVPAAPRARRSPARVADHLPRVAIVGRPNVGKSTLFNRFVGSRVAIVEPTAGVTRDRVSVPVRLHSGIGETAAEVVDTGGIGVVDRDDLGAHVEEQVRAAILSADLVLFLVDVRSGITPLDREVAARLRAVDLPVMLIVNKVEGERLEWDVDDFHSLGIHDGPYPISAQNGQGLEPLVERMAELLPAALPQDSPPPALRLAVVGRRNAGKSTLINQLAREERMIVSEVPGTTRDAVDVILERDGETFVVIDTAGVRKKKSFVDAIDFYSDARSYKAIRRADVVLLLFDATRPISSLEKRLARYVTDHHKPVVLVANKWDLAGDMTPETLDTYLTDQLPGLSFAPFSVASAKTGFHVQETLNLARELDRQARERVGTGELNRVIERALAARSPSSKGYRVKIYYVTQVASAPPTLVLFVNDRRLLGKDYLRYLENRLREELSFKEVPIRLVVRERNGVPTDLPT